MNAIRELVTVLKYQVDNSGLAAYQSGFKRLTAGVRRFGYNVKEAGIGLAEGAVQGYREVKAEQAAVLAGTQKQARDAQGRFLAGAQKHTAEVKTMGAAYGTAFGFLKQMALTYGVLSVTHIADEWAGVEARVGLATDNIEDQKTALEGIFQIAQETRQEYATVGELFARVSRNRKELGLDTGQTLDLSKTIGQAMTIGGGSADSQQAALMQLGQSLGKGRIDGEELNSILEQAPRLAQAIAVAFDTDVGKLKELGKAGKLTAKQFAVGMLKQTETLNAEFKRIPQTFGGSMTILKNETGRRISDLNKMSGASEKFALAIDLVVKNLGRILTFIGLIAARMALGRIITMLTRLSWKFLAPWLRMALVMEGVYLIGEDIWTWLNGGISVTGGLIGRFEEWQGTIDDIKTKIIAIKDFLGGVGEDLGPWLAKWGAIAAVGAAILKGLSMLIGPIKMILKFVLGLGRAFLWVGGLLVDLVVGIAALLGLPAILVAVIIAAIVALSVLIYKYWDEIVLYAQAVWDTIVAYAQAAWNNIGESVSVIVDAVDAIGAALAAMWDGAKNYALKTWQAIADWISNKITAIANMAADIVPDWAKSGASWLGNQVGIGQGDVQRAGANGAISQQTTVGNIYVTAPNSNPTAIAAATAKGVSQGLGGPRMAFPTPMVEAAP